jgi:PAS domain S-box-containing protein
MTATVDNAVADLQRANAELQRLLDERTAERDEALERETATAEVLQVINASPGDLAPVFDAMLERAVRLCGAVQGVLWIIDGERLKLAGTHRIAPAFIQVLRKMESGELDAPPQLRRLMAGERIVHIDDVAELDLYRAGSPLARAAVERGLVRTLIWVALVKEDTTVGAFAIARREVRPFSDKEIALLQNFAAQAVIAMENARLITETQEALDQQTATADVLQVINSSPGDLTPVFDAMLDKALGLCGAAFGVLWTYDGELVHATALRGAPPAFAEFLTSGPHPVGADNAHGRLLRGESVVHIADIKEDEAYRSGDPIRRTLVELGGGRSLLAVPLRKDDTFLGDFSIFRKDVRPFSDKEIALVQNFAAQAVIAMENSRLISETREALDQQTATAEVLQLINSSPGDLTPVFEAMLEKALDLCSAAFGVLWTYDGEFTHAAAIRGATAAYRAFLSAPHRPGPGSAQLRLIQGERFVHVADLAGSDDYRSGDALPRALVDLGGGRSLLAAPLRKDGAYVGAIMIYRQQPSPFSDKQIALLENFAAQAVIAMENARLLGELHERTGDLQESLEYQTATSDVLKVISRSPVDIGAVLEFVCETAARLCQVTEASIFRLENGVYRWAIGFGINPAYRAIEENATIAPGTGTLVGRVALGGKTVHILDGLADPLYEAKDDLRVAKVHTMLGVPLLRDGLAIGVICLARQSIEVFTDKQIELVSTFADQAVIAIENVRLIDEIRQRQAELRVTFDNMADGVVMFDEDLRLAAWNRNFQELLELPDAVLADRPSYADYLRILAERGEFGSTDIEAELGRRLQDTDQELRLERIRPDGRVIEVRRNAVPDGGFVLIYSDITERKRSEAEIRAARDAAEAALRDLKAAQANLIQAEKMASLGQLTAGIAHEITNPLNFVNNFASLSVELLDELKETTAPALATLDEAKRADADETIETLSGNLQKIAEHGKRADNIVKSMLEHSRGVSGELRAVDLNGVIEDALNLAYHGARAQDQGFNITLERDYASTLKPIELAPQEMTRVFLNLFGNGFYAATKRARENGDGSFRPSLTVATREDGDVVEVRVRDNGTGIPREIKDKLFQPFFTTKPTGEGTGLGLSISYDIVTQQHGGTITVESEPGAYTEFTIRLPRH